MDELVFAFPATLLWKLLPYTEQGFIPGDTDVLKTIVRDGQFRKRDEVEEDLSFKQIIPYGVISYKDSYYLFKRTGGQTDKRLPNLFYLGVGGHMNPGKATNPEELYIIEELKRELYEEVSLLNGCRTVSVEFKGLINDDTIEVGRFHIGLLYNIMVSGKDIQINEPDKMTAQWVDRSDLGGFRDEMETWTKIYYDSFLKKA